ncbi:MAG TPA: tRNA 2-thiouridine(34) synthase MnmA [Thermoguttaceae bacterium]|nr:tRNA 2-thiouridine(34) synthase MnmA [Thermoguttaceae bacterium]
MVRVVLAMSGGVDSTTAAWLLREQGYEVIGVFMRHGVFAPSEADPAPIDAAPSHPAAHPGKTAKTCCSAADATDARRVADRLGIPFYVLNFQEEFGQLIEYFVQEYLSGRTPNPCIVCNQKLKFGKLFDYADTIGAEYVATGHYARILPAPDGLGLYRGVDETKDQSYVLFGVPRNRLSRMLFPLGNYRKAEIRRWAAEAGLQAANKPESQEICFVPDQDHARFVRERRPDLDTSGPIVTTDGQVVGQHPGIEHFTIGQRKGLRVALGERRFVVRIEPQTCTVVIGAHEELARTDLIAAGANWLIPPPDQPFEAEVKIRYRTPAVPAVVQPMGLDLFQVRFHRPCYGVAPGQAAVCYQGDRLLGGGWIQ